MLGWARFPRMGPVFPDGFEQPVEETPLHSIGAASALGATRDLSTDC